jgi:hypothetical protein
MLFAASSAGRDACLRNRIKNPEKNPSSIGFFPLQMSNEVSS